MTIVGHLTTPVLLQHVAALKEPTVLELELADRLRAAVEEIEQLAADLKEERRGADTGG
jgi:hypothetical protein